MSKDCLKCVSQRFPQLGDQATRLFADDESFRELCEEYEACSLTVVRLEDRGASAQALRNEYKALLLRLEGELLRYLEAPPARHDS